MLRTIAALVTLPVLVAACGADGTEGENQPPRAETQRDVLSEPRFTTKKSTLSFEETLAALYRAIDERDLTVFASIDHQAGAAEADLQMRPATVVVFGSPAIGTALMQAEPILAAELPLRAAVYENAEGEVVVAVTSPNVLTRTYPGLETEKKRLERIAENLKTLAAEATGTEGR
ncbi:DUF302 domain-containing protein [Parvularcula maris]|uniref:DUF302 domain-containing protein n=1 Tax=Parvularcula maris TaxID=2965077 RepID=A0A9X2LCP4_9PROT|nr:DUF302 domain-containing protein [Parvularcula maris]MCQ8186082.1 DUF302 domain-containing protein [Parvularcula maris]